MLRLRLFGKAAWNRPSTNDQTTNAGLFIAVTEVLLKSPPLNAHPNRTVR